MPKFRLKKDIRTMPDSFGSTFVMIPIGTELDLEEVEEAKEWEPKMGDNFFLVSIGGEIFEYHWDNSPSDMRFVKFGNCFRTKDEATKARDAIKELLKGMGWMDHRRL